MSKEVYPKKVSECIKNLKNAGKPTVFDASATEVSFVCGTFIRFFLKMGSEDEWIDDMKFQTNSCGFSIFFSEILIEKVKRKSLTELRGIENLFNEVEKELNVPEDRKHCVLMVFNAFRLTFAELRRKRIQEFKGESALVCSCFGVSEDVIEKTIEELDLKTVEQVGQICRAGMGCGSCRPIIQDILDSRKFL